MSDRIVLGLLLLGALAGGCRTGTSGKAVPDSTMVKLLVELHLAHGRVEVTDRPLEFPRDSILRVYGVDSSAYANAIAYYAEHPEEYSSVYGRVLDRLSAERMPADYANSTRAQAASPESRDRPDTTSDGRKDAGSAPID